MRLSYLATAAKPFVRTRAQVKPRPARVVAMTARRRVERPLGA